MRIIPNQIFFIAEILKRMFKIGFWVQNRLLNLCNGVVNSQRLFYQKLVWNVCIKAFWYTKYFLYSRLDLLRLVFLNHFAEVQLLEISELYKSNCSKGEEQIPESFILLKHLKSNYAVKRHANVKLTQIQYFVGE